MTSSKYVIAFTNLRGDLKFNARLVTVSDGPASSPRHLLGVDICKLSCRCCLRGKRGRGKMGRQLLVRMFFSVGVWQFARMQNHTSNENVGGEGTWAKMVVICSCVDGRQCCFAFSQSVVSPPVIYSERQKNKWRRVQWSCWKLVLHANKFLKNNERMPTSKKLNTMSYVKCLHYWNHPFPTYQSHPKQRNCCRLWGT